MKEIQVNSSHSGQEPSKERKKAILISPSPFPHSKCSVGLSHITQYLGYSTHCCVLLSQTPCSVLLVLGKQKQPIHGAYLHQMPHSKQSPCQDLPNFIPPEFLPLRHLDPNTKPSHWGASPVHLVLACWLLTLF